MSYGTKNPWGLQAVRTQTDATWNGKTNTYPISSGYAQNIFKGDLVAIMNNGYLVNLFDVLNAPAAGGVARYLQNGYCQVQAIGVFDGCEYAVAGSANTDPANPGRSYWAAGTTVVNQNMGTSNFGAIGYVITDPQVVFNIQVGTGAGVGNNAPTSYKNIQAGTALNTGAIAANGQVQPGMFAPCCYVASAANIVQGNTQTGQSYMFLDTSSASTTNAAGLNLYIDALSSNPNNIPGVSYNNVEVVIANHLLRTIGTSSNQ